MNVTFLRFKEMVMPQKGPTLFASPSKVGGPECLVLLSEMRDKTKDDN